VRNYELGEAMEAVAPEVMDLAKESPGTLKLYGTDSPHKGPRLTRASALRRGAWSSGACASSS
jgi:hypothetical protein